MKKCWLVSLAVATLALAGCEQFDATAGVEPPPAEGRPFPNLASVPAPPSAGPSAGRQAEVDRLMASRDASIREDQQIRAIDPGRALPPPRLRTAPVARPATPDQQPAAPGTAAPAEQPAQQPRAAATPMPRPQLSSSLFMGTVLTAGQRGSLEDFQRRVLQDSVAMARRTNGRIRLVGGRSAEDRQAIVNELVSLGIAAGRISAAPDSVDATRAGIDVLVEN